MSGRPSACPAVFVSVLFLYLAPSSAQADDGAALYGVWEWRINEDMVDRQTFLPDGTGTHQTIQADGDAFTRLDFDWRVFAPITLGDGTSAVILRLEGERFDPVYQLVVLDGPDQIHTSPRTEEAIPALLAPDMLSNPLTFARVETITADAGQPAPPTTLHDQHEAAILGTWDGELDDERVRLSFEENHQLRLLPIPATGADAMGPLFWSIEDDPEIDGTPVWIIAVHVADQISTTAAVLDGPDRLLITDFRRRPPTSLSRQIVFARADQAAEAAAAAEREAWCGENPGVCVLFDGALAAAGQLDADGPRTPVLFRIAEAMADVGLGSEGWLVLETALSLLEEQPHETLGAVDLARLAKVQDALGLTDEGRRTREHLDAALDHIADVDVFYLFGLARDLAADGFDELAHQTVSSALARLEAQGEAAEGVPPTFPLAGLSEQFAAVGMLDTAEAIASHLDDDRFRAQMLLQIAAEHARAGDLATVNRLLGGIADLDPFDRALVLAPAQARTGDVAAAQATLSTVPDDHFARQEVAANTAEGFAEAGLFSEATGLLDALEEQGAFPPALDRVRSALALGYARAGEVDAGSAAAEAIAWEETLRATARGHVAAARSAAGDAAGAASDLDEALALVTEVADWQARLPAHREIALAMAEIGNAEGAHAALAGIAAAIASSDDLNWTARNNAMGQLVAAYMDAARTLSGSTAQ